MTWASDLLQSMLDLWDSWCKMRCVHYTGLIEWPDFDHNKQGAIIRARALCADQSTCHKHFFVSAEFVIENIMAKLRLQIRLQARIISCIACLCFKGWWAWHKISHFLCSLCLLSAGDQSCWIIYLWHIKELLQQLKHLKPPLLKPQKRNNSFQWPV